MTNSLSHAFRLPSMRESEISDLNCRKPETSNLECKALTLFVKAEHSDLYKKADVMSSDANCAPLNQLQGVPRKPGIKRLIWCLFGGSFRRKKCIVWEFALFITISLFCSLLPFFFRIKAYFTFSWNRPRSDYTELPAVH